MADFPCAPANWEATLRALILSPLAMAVRPYLSMVFRRARTPL
jgi:hypothetical protein